MLLLITKEERDIISCACHEKLVYLIDREEELLRADAVTFDGIEYERVDYCCRRLQRICDKLDELQ